MIRYTESMEEVFEIFRQCNQEPVYETVGEDEEGNHIALPCFIAK